MNRKKIYSPSECLAGTCCCVFNVCSKCKYSSDNYKSDTLIPTNPAARYRALLGVAGFFKWLYGLDEVIGE